MKVESDAESPMSRQELADFLSRMYESVRLEPEEWSNNTLELFLRGCSAWLNDMEGYFRDRGEDVPEKPTWGLIAMMVWEARTYQSRRTTGGDEVGTP